MHYLNIEGLYWELKQLTEQEAEGKLKKINTAFQKAEELVIEAVREAIKDNKKEIMKEIKESGHLD